jgi:hypothetical protein
MTNALPILPQALPLAKPMCDLKHPRARDVVVRVLDAVEYIPHIRRAAVELSVGGDEEAGEVFGGKVAEGTAVRVLCAGLIGCKDLLAATMNE